MAVIGEAVIDLGEDTDVEPDVDELFQQRLLMLAAKNSDSADCSTPSAAAPAQSSGGRGGTDGDLEDMVRDLLTALHKEMPADPLSGQEAAAARAAAIAAKKAAASKGQDGSTTGQTEGGSSSAPSAEPPKVAEAAASAVLAAVPPGVPAGLAAAMASAAAMLREGGSSTAPSAVAPPTAEAASAVAFAAPPPGVPAGLAAAMAAVAAILRAEQPPALEPPSGSSEGATAVDPPSAPAA
mmetsp:Transcript_43889/g.140670  ORF Transcript_43889/g.140670 Transcript_43889/m.140670 type:complete len:239 (-) Transcript_43889:67-783(-)|eukprot:CAMPEP_0203889388 /NCGR_PEP_ID=MMETSP0359-20131031/32937_1 /ASSEMBLY_ACC=CAM_ASM_000338 /TAXON_ID=268821 /ORGANISM="Scrippsiella Hangoei, Strain SHTV-5" /LENGTH=238 /DNA_ID=CAMNT_0050810797 /DNA_START=65 /DNA_END=781 /DNA_ORIENTATION=+